MLPDIARRNQCGRNSFDKWRKKERKTSLQEGGKKTKAKPNGGGGGGDGGGLGEREGTGKKKKRIQKQHTVKL